MLYRSMCNGSLLHRKKIKNGSFRRKPEKYEEEIKAKVVFLQNTFASYRQVGFVKEAAAE